MGRETADVGYSPIAAGLAFLPLTLTVMATAGLGSRFVNRVGTMISMARGMGLLAVGMFLLGRISLHGDYLSGLLPGFLFVALGLGSAFVTITIAGPTGVGDEVQGLASGLINTAQQAGSALGLVILVTMAAARTETIAGGGDFLGAALIEGYRYEFPVGAGLAVVGMLLALASSVRAG